MNQYVQTCLKSLPMSVMFHVRMMIPEPSIIPKPSDVTIPVKLNGKKVIALVDTGCTQTLVETDVVSECSVETDGPVMVKCIYGLIQPLKCI